MSDSQVSVDAPPQQSAGELSKIAKGGIWTLFGTIIGFLAGPLVSVFIVRRMSHQQYGELAIAADAAVLLSVLAAFGINGAAIQVVSAEGSARGESGATQAMAAAFALSRRLTLVALGILGLAAVVFVAQAHLSHSVVPLLLMGPVVVLAPYQGVIQGCYSALHWPRRLSMYGAISSILTGAALIVLIMLERPPAYVVASIRGASVILGMSLLYIPLRHWYKGRNPGRQVDFAALSKRLVHMGVAVLLGGIFAVVLLDFDVVVMGIFRSVRLTGVYAPTSAIAGGAMAILPIMGSFFFPAATRMATSGDVANLGKAYYWATRWTLVIAAPLLAMILIIPGDLLSGIFGARFVSMAMPLRIVGIGVTVHILTGLNDLTLDALGMAKSIIVRYVISIAVVVIGCFALIPPFGALGAASATAAGFIAVNLACSVPLYRRVKIVPFNGALWRMLLVLLAAGAVGAWAAHFVRGDLLKCFVVALVEFGAALLAAWLVAAADERLAIRRHFRGYLGQLPVVGTRIHTAR